MKESITINNSTAPYTTCQNCVVRGWCKRLNGSVALPDDYALNPECVNISV